MIIIKKEAINCSIMLCIDHDSYLEKWFPMVSHEGIICYLLFICYYHKEKFE